jgi:S-methylmethionine-dependent homocysteine/selenocysteine methylase
MIILDGAMGTELQKRGYQTKLPLWSASANLDSLDLVKSIHRDYVIAGAEIITTNTFRTIRRTYKRVGKEDDAVRSNKEAIRAALEIKRKFPDIKVAGSITTLEDCYEPELVPEVDVLQEEHALQMNQFKDSGIDLMIFETVNKLSEAEILLKNSSILNVPIWISFVTNPKGDLLSGESLEKAVELCKKYSVEAVLLNCRSPQTLSVAAGRLSNLWEGMKGIYANGAGHPHDELGWEFDDKCTPKEYLEYVDKWLKLGFEIIGGCCGTDPEFVKMISEKYSKR